MPEMTFETILTSSALIAAVLFLRKLLKGKIGSGMQYAVWLIVAVRLLLPSPLLPSRASIMNGAAETAAKAIEAQRFGSPGTEQRTPASIVKNPEQAAPAGADPDSPRGMRQPEIRKTLQIVWYCGAGTTAAVIVTANLIFYRKLRKTRKQYTTDLSRYKVYLTEAVSAPCIFGIFRGAIYVTEREIPDKAALRCILAHEEAHLRMKDPIWNVIRACCVILHWFNPLVWVAAALSRQDAEFACDAAAIRRIGEENRFLYGKTLVDMLNVSQKRSWSLSCGFSNNTKERILRIAGKTKTFLPAAVVLVLCISMTAACTFTGRMTEKQETKTEQFPYKTYRFTQLERFSELDGLSAAIQSVCFDKNGCLTADLLLENETGRADLFYLELFSFWRFEKEEWIRYESRKQPECIISGHPFRDSVEERCSLAIYLTELEEGAIYKIEALAQGENSEFYSFGVSFQMEESANATVYRAKDTKFLSPFSSSSADVFYKKNEEMHFVVGKDLFIGDSTRMAAPEGVFAKYSYYPDPHYVREDADGRIAVLGGEAYFGDLDLSGYRQVIAYRVLNRTGDDTGYRIYDLDGEIWIGHFSRRGDAIDTRYCDYLCSLEKTE